MKMKRYASFDDYLKDQNPANQAIIRALRRFVKGVQPGLSEAVKWGNGCWVGPGWCGTESRLVIQGIPMKAEPNSCDFSPG